MICHCYNLVWWYRAVLTDAGVGRHITQPDGSTSPFFEVLTTGLQGFHCCQLAGIREFLSAERVGTIDWSKTVIQNILLSDWAFNELFVLGKGMQSPQQNKRARRHVSLPSGTSINGQTWGHLWGECPLAPQTLQDCSFLPSMESQHSLESGRLWWCHPQTSQLGGIGGFILGCTGWRGGCAHSPRPLVFSSRLAEMWLPRSVYEEVTDRLPQQSSSIQTVVLKPRVLSFDLVARNKNWWGSRLAINVIFDVLENQGDATGR